MYPESSLATWIKTAERQHVRDQFFLKWLQRYFRPGRILELGAGCGQLSEILRELGWDVVGSDFAPFFVRHMQSRGLNATVIDATQIRKTFPQPVPNLLAQAISPIVSNDLSLVQAVYSSVFEALEPGGRFVFVFPISKVKTRYSQAPQHVPIIRQIGFKIVAMFRHHVVPASWYSTVNGSFLHFLDVFLGRLIGRRYILILEKPGTGIAEVSS